MIQQFHKAYMQQTNKQTKLKQSNCSFLDETVRKMWHMHTMNYYPMLKINSDLRYNMDNLGNVMLSEISHSQTDKCL